MVYNDQHCLLQNIASVYIIRFGICINQTSRAPVPDERLVFPRRNDFLVQSGLEQGNFHAPVRRRARQPLRTPSNRRVPSRSSNLNTFTAHESTRCCRERQFWIFAGGSLYRVYHVCACEYHTYK